MFLLRVIANESTHTTSQHRLLLSSYGASRCVCRTVQRSDSSTGGSAYNATANTGGSGVVIISSTRAAASTAGSPTISADASTRYYIFKNTGSITY